MRHRLLTALASGATLAFLPVAALEAAQGPDADSLTTLVAAASWVPTRGVAVAPLRRSIALDLKDVRIKQALQEIERRGGDRKSTRLNSSHSQISYAVFCLKKKKRTCYWTSQSGNAPD